MKKLLFCFLLLPHFYCFSNSLVDLDNGSLLVRTDQSFRFAELFLRYPDGRVELSQFELNKDIIFEIPRKDGQYRWEVQFTPKLSERVLERIRNVKIDQRDELYRQLVAENVLPALNEDSISGSFYIDQEKFVDPRITEPRSKSENLRKDTIHNNNTVIRNSLCVGRDCIDHPSYGFDTLRLNENNLRIKFIDSSGAASFPSNDWEIFTNDAGNGGLNRFSVRDVSNSRVPLTLEAGAPSHSVYLDDGGRLGLGTSVPTTDIDVVSGNTPTVRLRQNGSSGFSSQTWDVAGNETSFFIRDATNGSTLPFRIRPGADTNSIHIASDSNIGMNTASPQARLHVVDREGDILFRLDGSANEALIVANNGDVTISGTLNEQSSRSSKENFDFLDPHQLLDTVEKLDVPSWNYKHQTADNRHMGPIAEDFYAAFRLGTSDKHVAPGDIAAVALATVKALMTQLKEKDNKINSLSARLDRLEASLSTQ